MRIATLIICMLITSETLHAQLEKQLVRLAIIEVDTNREETQ
jgi:hypothetical protein